VISFFEGFSGAGFHRRPGYVAAWRPLYQGRDAIKIIGSPFSFRAAFNCLLSIDRKTLVGISVIRHV